MSRKTVSYDFSLSRYLRKATPILLAFALLLSLTACERILTNPGEGETDALVSGEVVNSDNESPIDGAVVSIFRADEDGNSDGDSLDEDTTGDRGKYKTAFTVDEDDRPDELLIEVEAEGFEDAERTVDTGQSDLLISIKEDFELDED